MGKRPYSTPQLTQCNAISFSLPSEPTSEVDEASLSRMRRLYLVNLRSDITIVAARFRVSGETGFGDWHAVSELPSESRHTSQGSNARWILLGYVPADVEVECQLKIYDRVGMGGVTPTRKFSIPARLRYGLAVLNGPTLRSDFRVRSF